MIDYNNYEYDENCVFAKQNLKDRLEKQLGDFGEQLVMTLLGRIARYSVAYVDHVGADLIASDKKGNSYAISVKSNQIGPTENETKVFSEKDQKKLCAFAKDFDLIPAVAMVFIPKDFAFIDVYLMTIAGFEKLSKRTDNIVEKSAVKKVKNGIQINNYSLGTGQNPKHTDAMGYLKYLHTNDLIEHIRLDVRNRSNFRQGLVSDVEGNQKYLEAIVSDGKDYNLCRQLGDAGEYLLLMLLGQLKKYKVARVDHVGADIIATDREGEKYAISVKTRIDGEYTYNELYSSSEIKKKYELSKLVDFCEKYKNMTAVMAYVFIKPDFSKADIYIATLDNWLDLGWSGQYGTAIQYVLDKSLMGVDVPVSQHDWCKNLGQFKVNNKKKNKKILDEIESIEHMEIEFSSLLSPNKKWK